MSLLAVKNLVRGKIIDLKEICENEVELQNIKNGKQRKHMKMFHKVKLIKQLLQFCIKSTLV